MTEVIAKTKKKQKKAKYSIAEKHDDMFDPANYGGVEPPDYLNDPHEALNDLQGKIVFILGNHEFDHLGFYRR